MEGINADNFDTFYDLLVQAVADALEVLASQVTLSLEDPELMDREDLGLHVFATVLAVGLENEEKILMEMESTDFKSDVNVEMEKKPALKAAGVAMKSATKPIARIKTSKINYVHFKVYCLLEYIHTSLISIVILL